MPVFEDWLNEPLSIVNNIFTSDPVNFDQKVQEYFNEKFRSEKNYNSIPCLNDVKIHELKPNCLVRYRCMIQDSFDPIYFSTAQKLKNPNTDETILMTFKYKEHLEIPEGFVECTDLPEQANFRATDSLETAMDTHGHSKKGQVSLQQRMTFYCVPIPGETEWTKNVYKSSVPVSGVKSFGTSSNTTHRPSKRPNDLNESMEENKTSVEATCLSEVTNSKTVELETTEMTANTTGTKKTKTKEDGDGTKIANNVNSLNFPLGSHETGNACLVKIYDDFEEYRINDLVEFIGILSQEPSLAYEQDENSDSHHQQNFQMSEKLMSQVTLEETNSSTMETDSAATNKAETKDQTSSPVLSSFPPSLVPRLHCIRAKQLKHNNSLMYKQGNEIDTKDPAYWSRQHKQFLSTLFENEASLKSGNEAAFMEASKLLLLTLRKEILACFQEMLLGDALAAEYLLMHLLSRVFMRKDVTTLGKFSLNFNNAPLNVASASSENQESNVNETFVDSFYKALSQFITMSHKFEFSINNLNQSNLIPSKDYDKNKLLTGMLQLPDCFQLVLDETKLNAGELTTKGLMNFNSIKDVISNQRLSYDFNYHQQEFPTNIRVLSISDTKSILPCDCFLKLNPTVERFDSISYESFIFELLNKKDSNLLDKFRTYLTVLSNLEYRIPDSVQKVVEDDIVTLKKDFNESSANRSNSKDKGKLIDIEAIHLILIVARLQSISYGQSDLTLNDWNNAKLLEFERLHNRV